MTTITNQKIFGPSVRILQASNALVRLARLDAALPQENRSKVLEAISKVLRDAEESRMQEALKSGLEKLNPKISALYLPEPSKVLTEQEIGKLFRRLRKDLQTVMIPPMTKADRGQEGPTFLVGYHRLNPLSHQLRSYSYVVKWTVPEELQCTEIYRAFSQNFLRETSHTPPSGFLVPAAAGIDFENAVHETLHRDRVHLDPEICESLKKNFHEIAKIYNATPENPYLMLAQRIDGENLVDFARNRYALLNRTQKDIFFKRLGRLTMLDLILGNLDRMVKPFMNRQKTYVLNGLGANLGNVLVVWSKETDDTPLFYAIDNGIDPDLLTDQDRKQKYLAFLRELFSGKPEEVLAREMQKSIQNALDRLPEDDESIDADELQVQVKSFSDDLKSAFPKLKLGLEEMTYHLQSCFIPGWEGQPAAYLRDHLQLTHPELLSDVHERIKAFKLWRN